MRGSSFDAGHCEGTLSDLLDWQAARDEMKEELMSRRPRFALCLALVSGLIASALTLGTAYAAPAERDAGLALTSLSNSHPDLVSGGDVLLRITAPRGVALDRVRVTRNGIDV